MRFQNAFVVVTAAAVLTGVLLCAAGLLAGQTTRPTIATHSGADGVGPSSKPATGPATHAAARVPAIDAAAVRSWVDVAGVFADRGEHEGSGPIVLDGFPNSEISFAPVRRQIDAMNRAAAGDARGAVAAVVAMNYHPDSTTQTLIQLARYRALALDPATALALLDAAPWQMIDGWHVAAAPDGAAPPATVPPGAEQVLRPVVSPLPPAVRHSRQLDLLRQIEQTGNATAAARLASAIPGAKSSLSPATQSANAGGAATRPGGSTTQPLAQGGATTRPALARITDGPLAEARRSWQAGNKTGYSQAVDKVLTQIEQGSRGAAGQPLGQTVADLLYIADFQTGLGDRGGAIQTAQRALAWAETAHAARPNAAIPGVASETDDISRQVVAALGRAGDAAGAIKVVSRIASWDVRRYVLAGVVTERIEAGDHAGARLALRAAVDDAVASSDAAIQTRAIELQNLAGEYMKIGDRADALKTLERAATAIEQMPEDKTPANAAYFMRVEPLRMIAQTQVQAGDPAAAVETLKKAVLHADKYVDGAMGIGPVGADGMFGPYASLAREYAKSGRTHEMDALLARISQPRIREVARTAAALGLIEARQVDQALSLAADMNAWGRVNVFVAAAEAKLNSGDKQSAAKLAADAGKAIPEADPLGGAFGFDIRPRLINVQLGAGDIRGALATVKESNYTGLGMEKFARASAGSGNDKTATMIADGADNRVKPRVWLAVGMGRLDRGDRAGAAEAYHTAIESSSTNGNPRETADLTTETADAQQQAGDVSGARDTYAIGARTTAMVNWNQHGIPDALRLIAMAQIRGGDLQGAADWIPALSKSDLRRLLYLNLASSLLQQATLGEADHVLRLTPGAVPQPASLRPPLGAVAGAEPKFQGKPMKYWLDSLHDGGFHRYMPTPQQKEQDALAESAVTALATIGKPAVSGLVAMLKEATAKDPENPNAHLGEDASEGRLFRATRALSQIGADAVPALVELIKSAPETIGGHHATSALSGIGAPAAGATAELLSDPNPAVRRRAALVIEMPTIAPTSVAAIIKACKDADPGVRRLAVQALRSAADLAKGDYLQTHDGMSRLGGDPQIVNALIDALSDSDGEVRFHAADQLPYKEPSALRPVVGKMIAALAATPRPRLGTDPNLMVRKSLVKALGRSGSPEAVAVIVKSADNTNQGEVSGALAAIGRPAVPVLAELLKKPGLNRTIALNALEGMVQSRPVGGSAARAENPQEGAARRADILSGAMSELTQLANDPDLQVATSAKRLIVSTHVSAN